MTNIKLGVFICECRGEISSILKMDALESALSDLPGLAHLQRLPNCCLPNGLAAIKEAVSGKGLNRVLVAACTPRTMALPLRRASEEAGLAGNWVELVDIREGCAWVHADDAQGATAKAVDLIRMGVAELCRRESRDALKAEVVPAALVIGGGLAGMTAAQTLGAGGVGVKLVERAVALGGGLRGVPGLSPDGREGPALLQEKQKELQENPQVEVMLGKQVTSISGTVGSYRVHVDGSQNPGDSGVTFDVGAIVVATGAQQQRARGCFGHDGRRVVTQFEFQRELRNPPASRSSGSTVNPPLDVVMILCVGQRDEQVRYCSKVCCLAALRQALQVREANPRSQVTIVFRDLHLPGKDARAALQKAKAAGVRFMRYLPASRPAVLEDVVQVHDQLSGQTYRLPYDRVVLATPLVPQSDAGVLAYMLHLPQDANGFFPQPHYRLRPQNVAERGIYVCGAAHFPADWQEVEFQALSAAFAALRHLQSGVATHEAPVVRVDQDLCSGCGTCVSSCAFGAISMQQRQGVLDVCSIDPLLCKGCGNCVVACPSKSLGLPVDSDAAILAQIEAALSSPVHAAGRRIVVFGCEWSGYAAAELAGARKMSYPSAVRLIRVGCSARLDPTHVLWALCSGADGVFIAACPPGECHYLNGNEHAQRRTEMLADLLRRSGFDQRRVRLEWIDADDAEDFCRKISDFERLVRALGPSPARSH